VRAAVVEEVAGVGGAGGEAVAHEAGQALAGVAARGGAEDAARLGVAVGRVRVAGRGLAQVAVALVAGQAAAEAPLVGVVGHALRVRAALREKRRRKNEKKIFQKKNLKKFKFLLY
jgi:hypothetical protein